MWVRLFICEMLGCIFLFVLFFMAFFSATNHHFGGERNHWYGHILITVYLKFPTSDCLLIMKIIECGNFFLEDGGKAGDEEG